MKIFIAIPKVYITIQLGKFLAAMQSNLLGGAPMKLMAVYTGSVRTNGVRNGVIKVLLI